MSLRLILMRHAKSDWDLSDLDDHDRVLSPRGRRACDAVGAWLAGAGYLPDQVLCSSSVRTCETWTRLSVHLPDPPPLAPVEALYLASAQTMFDCLSGAEGTCVAVLGHNPGIGTFASQLVRARPPHRDFGRYPTLATLVLDFDIPTWADLARHSGNVVDFVTPKDLNV